MDVKAIKDSQHMPDGIRKIADGGLFIDVDKIKSFVPNEKHVNIEYFDGTYIQWYPTFVDNEIGIGPKAEKYEGLNYAKLLEEHKPEKSAETFWFEKDKTEIE